MKVYNSYTEEKWNLIKTTPYLEKCRARTIARADDHIVTPPPAIKFSDLHLFATTGDRSRYEAAYFEINNRVDNTFVAYMLTEDEKYLNNLSDEIWNLCNIESWALPAHVKETADMDYRRGFLELVSCNVGRRLGDIYALVGDKLPELVTRRMKYEVRERIIKPYMNPEYTFGWYHGESNWAAVCIAGVLGSFLYFAEEEEIKRELPRMIETAECYLRGFDEEGCCKEGYGYWSYGFRHFCSFAEMLNIYTNGEKNYFKDPKVHSIAKFQENMAINEHQSIRFSDCDGAFAPQVHLSQFLKRIYPDVQIPSIPAPTSPIAFDLLCWIEPEFAISEMKPESKIYKINQWFIHRGEKYNFVCKAGCNDEPHNHNDVGSFMISNGGYLTFTDPGGGEYTRQYFGPERYTILEPSARSHSLPIINGEYEVKKTGMSTIYEEGEGKYAFSMENAYDIPTLKSLKRSFVCTDDEIILTDTYTLTEDPTSIVERFVTLVEPKIEEGKVTVGETVFEYDKNLFTLELNTDTCVRKGKKEETLYMIDLTPKTLAKEMEFTFKFR